MTLLLIVSTGLFVAAALMSARHAYRFEKPAGWIAVTVALGLLATRQAVCVYNIVIGGSLPTPAPETEILNLVTALAALVGVTLLGPVFSGNRKLLNALEESRRDLQGFAEASADFFWATGPDLRWTYLSETFEKVTGLPHNRLIGKTRAEVTTPVEDQANLKRHLEDLEAHRPFVGFTHHRVKADGSRVYLSISGKPVFDDFGKFLGYRGTGRDITQRVVTERKLLQQTAFLNTIFDNFPLALYVKDAEDRRYIRVNPACLRMMGMTEEQVLGRTDRDLYPNERATFFEMTDTQALEKDGLVDLPEDQIPWNGAGAQIFHTQKIAIHIPDTGKSFILCLTEDITEKVNTERKLEVSLTEARKANAAKSEFLAKMSHELRTPLNAILGFSDMMVAQILDVELPEPHLTYAGNVHKSGLHLLGMVNDLLDVARIESGVIQLDERRFDLLSSLRDCVTTVKEQPWPQPPEVDIDFLAGSLPFFGDEVKISQIVANVLSNAIGFSRDGVPVKMRVRQSTGQVEISVIDNGPGIPEHVLPKLFDPFYQAPNQSRSTGGGAGLGLSIAKSLAEMHGGGLSVDSALDQGTTVTICLPTDREPRQAAE